MRNSSVLPVERRRRELILSASFAVWGLVIAIGLLPVWYAPAPDGQPVGFATRENFHAATPFKFVAGLIVLPLALPFLLRPLTRRLVRAQRWTCGAVGAAVSVSLWYVAIERDLLWSAGPVILVLATCLLLGRIDLQFTRRDWILLPTSSAVFLALIDVLPLPVHQLVVCTLLLVFLLRVSVTFIASPMEPALAFAAAPLGVLLQTSFFARDQRYLGWHALVIAVVSPFLVRRFLRNRRVAIALVSWIVYPIAVYSYMNATSLVTAEAKPRIYFFEQSHSLAPAGEYLRGELPYRDVMPVHGLLEDGLLDFAAAQRGESAGNIFRVRGAVGTLNAIAVYALGAAMTGTPEAGLLAWFFWLVTSGTTTTRILPALVTLVFIALAVRLNRPRWLIAAGAGCVLCGINSLDYAFYTTATLCIAALRFSPPRAPALRYAALGIAAATVPLFVLLLGFGILDDFFTTTFVEVLSLGPAYTLRPFNPPASLGPVAHFPDLLLEGMKRDVYPYVAWAVIVVAAGVVLANRRRRRTEPLLLLALWIVLAAVSYAERQHIYFVFVLPIAFVVATWTLWRRRNPAALVMIVLIVIISAPTAHVGVVGWVRRARGPVSEDYVDVKDIPRARGALFLKTEAEQLRLVKEYVDRTLRSDETFFDFTNRGILHFLLDRDCPIRFVEVAYYQTEERQREVIEALRRNPKVRAVLMPLPGGLAVDNVLNGDRAPLVGKYIEENFQPDFASGAVVFWRKK